MAKKFKEFATLMPPHLGIKKSLWLLGETSGRVVSLYPPYYNAVLYLRELENNPTPTKKLSCLKKVVRSIHQAVYDYYRRINDNQALELIVM